MTWNDRLIRLYEEHARSFLRAQNETKRYTIMVCRLLVLQLKEANLGIEAVADQLSMSVRSLQMKLREEGTSYQQLLNSMRKYLAVACLREAQIRKSDIARMLGFSEISVFSRTFKKWTGKSPSAYQAALD